MKSLTLEDVLDASKRGDDIAVAKMLQIWRASLKSNPSAASLMTPEQFVSSHRDVAIALADLLAAASDPHEQHILRPCGLFGRVEPEITPLQVDLIQRLLETHWAFYHSGRLPTPVYKDVYGTGRGLSDAVSSTRPHRRERLLFAVGKNIHCHPNGVTSDVYLHLPGSAAAAGYTISKFETDRLMPTHLNANNMDGEAVRTKEFSDLLDRLDEFAPDVVVAEGNFGQDERFLSAKRWKEMKEKFKFKLVVYIGDTDETTGHIVNPWNDVADLIVSFHGPAKPFYDDKNFVVVPSLPFDETVFVNDAIKTRPFFFSGSNQRYRKTWLMALAAANFPVEARLHGRLLDENATLTDDFYKAYGQAKMTFTNGWLDPIASITAGRTFEAILSKTLVLEQSGAPTFEYFIPFVHYVPVQNATQMILFARFFDRFENWRASITNAAFDYYMENYQSQFQWDFLVSRVTLARE